MEDKAKQILKLGYKLSEIGEIPNGWKVARLGEVLEFIRNGLTYRQTKDGNGYPLTRIETISDGVIDKTRVGYSAELTEREIESYKLKLGDILLSHINSVEHIGKTAIYEGDPPLLIHGMNLLLLRVSEEKALAFFLIQYFKWNVTRNRLRLMAKKAVNQASINQTELKSVLVPLPPLPEQRKIAEILSTVDEAIQKTDEIIQKTEELKKGLMQQLLTKGIGHSKFKLTEIGEIPEGWEVVKLKEVISDIKTGFASGRRDEEGIVQLRMNNISTEGKIVLNHLLKVPLHERANDYLLRPGDILFNNTNSVDLIGKTALFRGELENCVYSNHFTRLRTIQEQCTPEWLTAIFVQERRKGIFKAICHRHVHQAGINNDDILFLKVPLPPLPEQRKIAEILSAIDEKIEVEWQRKEKLEELKRGLMQVLLTGKVRVKVA